HIGLYAPSAQIIRPCLRLSRNGEGAAGIFGVGVECYGAIQTRQRSSLVLKTALLQPDILRALAGAGHGSQVLITDGNYPASTGAFAGAVRVYLNLAPGLVNATDVLRVLTPTIPIEAAHVMQT